MSTLDWALFSAKQTPGRFGFRPAQVKGSFMRWASLAWGELIEVPLTQD